MNGYTKTQPKIVNLLDKIFTMAANVFPIDYVIVTLTVYYFVCATMSGVKTLGVRFCHLKMFSIRAHRTVPQGLLFLSFILVFVILCLNIVLLTLSPNYSTYGNQMYSKGVASDWSGDNQCIGYAAYPTNAEQCSSQAPGFQLLVNTPAGCELSKGDCEQWQVDIPLNKNQTAGLNKQSDWHLEAGACIDLLGEVGYTPAMKPCAGVPPNQTLPSLMSNVESCEITEPCLKTRLAGLMQSFFFNFKFLGICYFWANWGFIAVFMFSFVWCTCKRRKSLFQALINDVQSDLLGDDDDDMTPFKPSWMA